MTVREALSTSPEDFAIVAIGASAGGLQPLLALFERMPADSGMAFIVVLHLSPQHESGLAGLLQGTTRMRVVEVRQPVMLAPNVIYVISPRNQLHVEDGRLVPEPRPEGAHPLTIDRLFSTLASVHGNRAFAVVLSGTGSDGAQGVREIRAHGGVSLAQVPSEAEHDSMPRNAIGTGTVDLVLPVGEMPAQLLAIWENAQKIALPPVEDKDTPEDVADRAEAALRDILALVRARTGHDFAHYKRSTLMRRIERRLQVNQLRDLQTYRDFLADNADETRGLLRDLLISVTSFFRDPEVFKALEETIIPMLLTRRDRRGGPLRVWVVGCATGEEVYSLAMLFVEGMRAVDEPPELSIFATDIDENALAIARAALYPESIRESVSAERLQRFFTKEVTGYRVQTHLRDTVMFATHNVIQDPPFSRLDLISCRNLLIYVTRETQAKVLDLLHFSLRADGYLVLGSAESIDEANEGFMPVDKQHRIFQQQPRTQAGLVMSSFPVPQLVRNTEAPGPPGRRLLSYGELHQRLLEHYAPPSVVVNDRYDIVHVSDTAGRFLQIGAGEPSLNLLQVVPAELRAELRHALDKALQSMLTVERRNVPFDVGPQRTHVTLRVHPVHEKRTTRTYALVIFDTTLSPDERPVVEPARDDDAVSGLQERLQDTETLLRGAIAQYEVRNEELKASNEELQATNEELRATSEELETGKEELQSINEELQTVNQELKNKVDETTRIRDDLQNFINATEIAVLFVDRERRLMRFTPFARRVFNVRATDVGRPLTDITNRLVDEDLGPDLDRLFETLAVIEREVRGVGGQWYLLRALPYRTTDDRIEGAVLTFIDVTQRKEAAETVRRNEAWLRLLLDSVRDYAILTLDPRGMITSWNAPAEKIFGYAPAEAIGQPFAILFLPEDRDAGTPENELRTAREIGRAEDERWQLRKDGTRFFASGVTAPLLDPDAYGYVKLCRDLTEQQIATQRRDELLAAERISRAAAEEASRMKDEFLATLSHELRNPLSLIQMQAELLMRAPETRRTPRLASAAEIIHQTVKAQSQFVDDMLDVSRARTGKLAIDRQLVPLPLILADSIGALRDDAEKNDISLNVEIDPEPMIVEADAVRVKQIAWNLLSNALKFTPHGGHIDVRLRREGQEARLDVQDNGQGIAPDVLPHIFEWFRQGESGSTRRRGGMGIGLALVRQLVELHGGRVKGHSEGVGKGACFSVWLPLQQASEPVRAAASGEPPPAPSIGRLQGLRLLVIDDAPGNADAMRELLQLEGAHVAIETTAHDAIARAKRDTFDVIISDLAMPEMDGYTMLKEIRRGTANAATPAIAYSGYGGPEEVARSKAAGFELHLTKPVEMDHLMTAITSIVEDAQRRPRGALQAGNG